MADNGNRRRAQLLNQPSKFENSVYYFLLQNGYNPIRQFVVNGKFAVDFFIAPATIVESDGDYWHSSQKQIARDQAKDKYLLACGYKVVRIRQSEFDHDPTLLLKRM